MGCVSECEPISSALPVSRASQYIADAIDRGMETSLFVLALEPAPRLHVGSAERRPHDAATLRTDRAQLVQVRK